MLFFTITERSVSMALVFYYKDLLEKVPSNFQLLFVTERNQLNATHAQLLEKLRPTALAETCRFLTIHSLEFQEIWQKIARRPRN